MIQEVQQIEKVLFAQLTDEQYAEIEQDTLRTSQAANIAFSWYAIAMNIVFCVLVFKEEATDSKICSIVASSLFMVFHCYNFKATGFWISLFCIGPIFIAGYVIGRHDKLNTFVFIFQIFLWQGEYVLSQIVDLNNRLTLVRQARNPKKEQPITLPPEIGKLIIEINKEVQKAVAEQVQQVNIEDNLVNEVK